LTSIGERLQDSRKVTCLKKNYPINTLTSLHSGM